MARKKAQETESAPVRRIRPALTPQAHENQLINLAMDLAEKQLLEGTASSQVMTHFLRLATEREKTEREKAKLEMELIRAKTEALESQQRSEEMYAEAIAAMKTYSGNGGDEDGFEELDDYDYD